MLFVTSTPPEPRFSKPLPGQACASTAAGAICRDARRRSPTRSPQSTSHTHYALSFMEVVAAMNANTRPFDQLDICLRHPALVFRNERSSLDRRTHWPGIIAVRVRRGAVRNLTNTAQRYPSAAKRGGYLRGSRSRELHRGCPYSRDTDLPTQTHPDAIPPKLTQGCACVHVARGEDLPDSMLKSAMYAECRSRDVPRKCRTGARVADFGDVVRGRRDLPGAAA